MGARRSKRILAATQAVHRQLARRNESGAEPTGSTPLKRSHRRATLPQRKLCSTIAEAGLNFRVRNGNGCGPCSRNGGKIVPVGRSTPTKSADDRQPGCQRTALARPSVIESFFQPIGAQACLRERAMVKPHGQLVPVSSTHYCASTSGLSTSSSRTALQ